jgi:hypothetical protein
MKQLLKINIKLLLFAIPLLLASIISTAQPPFNTLTTLRAPSVMNTAVATGSLFLGSGMTTSSTISSTTMPVTTAQWRFTGQQDNTNSGDWIYSLVTTSKKETIACGFGQNSANAHSGTVFKLDHVGNMVWNTAVVATASLSNVQKYNFSSTSSVSASSSTTETSLGQ